MTLDSYDTSRYPTLGVSLNYPASFPIPSKAEDRRRKRIEIEITTPKCQKLPWDGFATADNTASDPASDACFARLRSWLQECSSQHTACTKSRNGALTGPKRLIDVGFPDTSLALRLIDTRGECPQFIALSHCWGRSEIFQTTRETLQQRQQSISYNELPRTFQDAVTICRRLSIRYLWIDSLCIIQHDRADWEAEAPGMETIYGSAYLVVAASHASDSTTSMFTQRPPSYNFDFELNGVDYAVSVKERISHDIWNHREPHHDQTLPLLGRAWGLQERLLAARIVHYTHRELVWECKTHVYCECSGVQWPAPYRTAPNNTSLKTRFAEALMPDMDAASRIDFWLEVVAQYTARDLTVESDRLPALSGLAKVIHIPAMGNYVAGLWSASLPGSLEWRIESPRKPHSYRAPSWSWASVEGPVRLLGNRADLLRMVEVSCTPATHDPYGEVLDGYIVVEGDFAPIDPRKHEALFESEMEAFALKTSFSDWGLYWCLLLKRSSRVAGAYERVGIECKSEYIFEGLGKSTIKIV